MATESIINLDSALKICRIINGMWQVSGAHGFINREDAIRGMELYHNNGFITWDLADHYGPAEDFVKIFRERIIRENGVEGLKDVRFFTKWVPRPQKITKSIVNAALFSMIFN